MIFVYVVAYDSTLHTYPRDFCVYCYKCDISSFEYVSKEWFSLYCHEIMHENNG